MKMLATATAAACVSLFVCSSICLAQTTATPPSAAPAATDKAAISKACTDQANAQNLHGKPRKVFRSKCKKEGGKPAT